MAEYLLKLYDDRNASIRIVPRALARAKRHGTLREWVGDKLYYLTSDTSFEDLRTELECFQGVTVIQLHQQCLRDSPAR